MIVILIQVSCSARAFCAAEKLENTTPFGKWSGSESVLSRGI